MTTAIPAAGVCIIGSGPAGVVLALELARAGHDVLLVESGRHAPDDAIQSLGDATIDDTQAHVAMRLATRRQVGGASNIWGGRCVPFDPVDFDERPYVTRTKWPVTYEEMAAYFQRTSDWFMTGHAVFNTQDIPEVRRKTLVPGLPDGDMRSSDLERWSLPTNFRTEYARPLASTPGLRLATGLTCVEIMTDPSGRTVRGLRCRRMDGTEELLTARRYVVACGGLESTRLLLASRSVVPSGLGNHSGLLGRYYMGHVSGNICRVIFETPPGETAYEYERDRDGVYVRHRLSLSRAVQHRERLPNIVAWLVNPHLADPSHGSGILSFAYLALSSPMFGKRFVAEGIRRAAVGSGPRVVWPHVANMLRDLPATASFIPMFAYRRFLKRRKAPGFFVRSPNNRYVLHYYGEHMPNHESRVMLDDSVDRLGMPRLRIQYRFQDADFAGVVRAHTVWDAYLRKHRCGRLEYDAGDPLENARTGQGGGYHQSGMTRMAANSDDGVVDPNLRVHGIDNLYVASSSTFVTSGQANSTFMLVAFALRLADHLNHTRP
jgi:choline dehydrogenase-like flavoprotein